MELERYRIPFRMPKHGIDAGSEPIHMPKHGIDVDREPEMDLWLGVKITPTQVFPVNHGPLPLSTFGNPGDDFEIHNWNYETQSVDITKHHIPTELEALQESIADCKQRCQRWLERNKR